MTDPVVSCDIQLCARRGRELVTLAKCKKCKFFTSPNINYCQFIIKMRTASALVMILVVLLEVTNVSHGQRHLQGHKILRHNQHSHLNRTSSKLRYLYYPIRPKTDEDPRNSRNTTFDKFQSTSQIKIPLVINVDNILLMKYISKYGKNARRHLKNHIKNTVKEVTRSFQHASLGRNVVVEVYDVNFLRNNTRVLPITANAPEYLKNYCKWQSRKKEKDNTWYSVLLTGLDLYSERNGTRFFGIEAISYNTAMCNLKKSCTVAEGTPKNLIHRLTHEIAHSLGIRHDGAPWNRGCPVESHIMSYTFNQHKHPTAWSKCSGNNFDKYLRSKRSWCLK